MDKDKGLKIPVQLRVNMWLGLSAHEKKFNTFSSGNFSVYAEMVRTSAPKYYWNVYIYDFTRLCLKCCWSFFAVWEPGSGVWEVGNHRPGRSPQVLRRDGKGETQTGALSATTRMGLGRRLVCGPWTMVGVRNSLYHTGAREFRVQMCSYCCDGEHASEFSSYFSIV